MKLKSIKRCTPLISSLVLSTLVLASVPDGESDGEDGCDYQSVGEFARVIGTQEHELPATDVAEMGESGLGLGASNPRPWLTTKEAKSDAHEIEKGKWIGKICNGRVREQSFDVYLAEPQLNWTSPLSGRTADITGTTSDHAWHHENAHILVSVHLCVKISQFYNEKVTLIKTRPRENKDEAKNRAKQLEETFAMRCFIWYTKRVESYNARHQGFIVTPYTREGENRGEWSSGPNPDWFDAQGLLAQIRSEQVNVDVPND